MFPYDQLPSGKKLWHLGVTENFDILMDYKNRLEKRGWKVQFAMGANKGTEWGFVFSARGPGRRAVEVQTNEVVPDSSKTVCKARFRWGFLNKESPEGDENFDTPQQLQDLIRKAEAFMTSEPA